MAHWLMGPQDDDKQAIRGEVEPIPRDRSIIPADDPRDFRALGFDKLTPAERSEMARRGVEARRMKAEMRRLAEAEVFHEEHRQLAARILGTKMVVWDGLLKEATDPATGEVDTSRLDDKRLKVLLGLVDQVEKRGFPSVTKTETTTTVNVNAVIAKLNALGADE
jgi:hypothetical protein